MEAIALADFEFICKVAINQARSLKISERPIIARVKSKNKEESSKWFKVVGISPPLLAAWMEPDPIAAPHGSLIIDIEEMEDKK